MTLLEVVLAMGLLVLLSSMTYWFYGSSLSTRSSGLQANRKVQLARVVLDRMATEIRQIAANTQHRDVAILGSPDRLWISTVRLPHDAVNRYQYRSVDDPRPEFDLVKIEYKIATHPDIDHEDGYPLPLGLARVELRTRRMDSAETGEAFRDPDEEFIPDEVPEELSIEDADPIDPSDPEVDPQMRWEELYAPEIKYVRYCYFDGKNWWDDWDIQGDNPLPQLMQVTIGYEPQPPYDKLSANDDAEEFCTCMNQDPMDCEPHPPGQYTMVVRLTQADVMFTSRITRESVDLLEQMGADGAEGGGP